MQLYIVHTLQSLCNTYDITDCIKLCKNCYFTNFYSRYLSTINKMYIGSTREIENKHLCTALTCILIIRLNITFNRIMNFDTAQEYN